MFITADIQHWQSLKITVKFVFLWFRWNNFRILFQPINLFFKKLRHNIIWLLASESYFGILKINLCLRWIIIFQLRQCRMTDSIWPTRYFVILRTCTFKITDHLLQNLMSHVCAVSLDRSPSPASPSHSQYYTSISVCERYTKNC